MRFEQGGAGFAPPIDNPVLLDSRTLLNVGTTFNTGIFYDMRAYQSYALKLELTGGTFATNDMMNVFLKFFMAPNAAAQNFVDDYRIYRTDITGSSPFYLTDVCHGSWMQFQIDNFDPGAGANTNLSYQLYGSYRPVSNTFLRSGSDGLVLWKNNSFLAGGANAQGKAFMAYGPAYLVLQPLSSAGATLDIRYGEESAVVDELVVPAGTALGTKQIVLPRRQMNVTVINNSVGNQSVRSCIYQNLQPN